MTKCGCGVGWGTCGSPDPVPPVAAEVGSGARMWACRPAFNVQPALANGTGAHMTSNQRRPGFRLPWAAEAASAPGPDAADTPGEATPPADGADAAAASKHHVDAGKSSNADGTAAEPAAAEDAADLQVEPAPIPSAEVRPSSMEPSTGFMRDLVAAMRRVAEETRRSGLSALRTRAEEHVRTLEADAEHRREELKSGAEADVVAVGNWADAEKQRIEPQAEQRVAARRARLDQQLAAETTRAEVEAT